MQIKIPLKLFSIVFGSFIFITAAHCQENAANSGQLSKSQLRAQQLNWMKMRARQMKQASIEVHRRFSKRQRARILRELNRADASALAEAGPWPVAPMKFSPNVSPTDQQREYQQDCVIILKYAARCDLLSKNWQEKIGEKYHLSKDQISVIETEL